MPRKGDTMYRKQKSISIIMIIAGLILQAWMIVIEDEPGAVPLLMIATGTIWYGLISRKEKD